MALTEQQINEQIAELKRRRALMREGGGGYAGGSTAPYSTGTQKGFFSKYGNGLINAGMGGLGLAGGYLLAKYLNPGKNPSDVIGGYLAPVNKWAADTFPTLYSENGTMKTIGKRAGKVLDNTIRLGESSVRGGLNYVGSTINNAANQLNTRMSNLSQSIDTLNNTPDNGTPYQDPPERPPVQGQAPVQVQGQPPIQTQPTTMLSKVKNFTQGVGDFLKEGKDIVHNAKETIIEPAKQIWDEAKGVWNSLEDGGDVNRYAPRYGIGGYIGGIGAGIGSLGLGGLGGYNLGRKRYGEGAGELSGAAALAGTGVGLGLWQYYKNKRAADEATDKAVHPLNTPNWDSHLLPVQGGGFALLSREEMNNLRSEIEGVGDDEEDRLSELFDKYGSTYHPEVLDRIRAGQYMSFPVVNGQQYTQALNASRPPRQQSSEEEDALYEENKARAFREAEMSHAEELRRIQEEERKAHLLEVSKNPDTAKAYDRYMESLSSSPGSSLPQANDINASAYGGSIPRYENGGYYPQYAPQYAYGGYMDDAQQEVPSYENGFAGLLRNGLDAYNWIAGRRKRSQIDAANGTQPQGSAIPYQQISDLLTQLDNSSIRPALSQGLTAAGRALEGPAAPESEGARLGKSLLSRGLGYAIPAALTYGAGFLPGPYGVATKGLIKALGMGNAALNFFGSNPVGDYMANQVWKVPGALASIPGKLASWWKGKPKGPVQKVDQYGNVHTYVDSGVGGVSPRDIQQSMASGQPGRGVMNTQNEYPLSDDELNAPISPSNLIPRSLPTQGQVPSVYGGRTKHISTTLNTENPSPYNASLRAMPQAAQPSNRVDSGAGPEVSPQAPPPPPAPVQNQVANVTSPDYVDDETAAQQMAQEAPQQAPQAPQANTAVTQSPVTARQQRFYRPMRRPLAPYQSKVPIEGPTEITSTRPKGFVSATPAPQTNIYGKSNYAPSIAVQSANTPAPTPIQPTAGQTPNRMGHYGATTFGNQPGAYVSQRQRQTPIITPQVAQRMNTAAQNERRANNGGLAFGTGNIGNSNTQQGGFPNYPQGANATATATRSANLPYVAPLTQNTVQPQQAGSYASSAANPDAAQQGLIGMGHPVVPLLPPNQTQGYQQPPDTYTVPGTGGFGVDSNFPQQKPAPLPKYRPQPLNNRPQQRSQQQSNQSNSGIGGGFLAYGGQVPRYGYGGRGMDDRYNRSATSVLGSLLGGALGLWGGRNYSKNALLDQIREAQEAQDLVKLKELTESNLPYEHGALGALMGAMGGGALGYWGG